MKRFREWIASYWITYVSMSRAERRRIVEILNESSLPEDFVEAERP